VTPFNFGTSLNTGAQLYAAHGVSIQGQCVTGSVGQDLVITATASADNQALYATQKEIDDSGSEGIGDANFDSGESLVLQEDDDDAVVDHAAFIGSDGAVFTLIFGGSDDDGQAFPNGGSAANPGDPALGGAGCLIWGTRQLG
jgi:hypothetical protein